MPAVVSVTSRNVLLSAAIALTSYVPFEWVAKATLLVSLGMFILDPFPPNSRLVAMLSCAAVLYMNRLYQKYLAENDVAEGVVLVEEEQANGETKKEQ